MRITRRTLLLGAGAGVASVLLASCTPEPTPTPTPTRTREPEPPPGVPAAAGSIRSTWTTDPYALGAASFTPNSTICFFDSWINGVSILIFRPSATDALVE